MKKEALILIDIQDVYFMPGPYLLHKPKEAARNAGILLERFRAEKKTIVHVKHDFGAYAEIHKSVAPLPDEKIIFKKYPSSFLGTELQEYLVSQGIEKLVVAGMMSHMCVDTTVRACQDYGYEVVVIEDACTTKNLSFHGTTIPAETVHATFMAALDGMFAKVIKLADLRNGDLHEDKKGLHMST